MIPIAKLIKKRRPSSILGLALDGNRLEAVVVRRLNGTLQVQQTVSATLALSPLTGDPELAGREIRNHLDQAGIRERRCAVCLPLNLVLTLQTKIPELPEADVAGYLQLEAERGFHSGPENLFIADSRAKSGGGEQLATLMGVPRNQLAAVETVLKAAQLKVLTFSLGVAATQPATLHPDRGTLTLALGNNSFELQVTAGGGIVALRSLDGVLEGEGAQRHIDDDLVAREIRITLGQLPSEFGDRIKYARICGRGEIAKQFTADITSRLESMGMKVEVADRASTAEFDKPLPPEIALSPALALAANYVRGAVTAPELLPPKISAWQQFMQSSKFSSKKMAWAGAAAGFVVLCVAGAFGVQQWQISRLNSEWKSMESQYNQLMATNDHINKFRPWFDRTFRALRIVKTLTEAFPVDGSSVSAKSVEIRDLTTVSCSGIARDNPAYFGMLDKLQDYTNEVSELKTDSLRGQSPAQFTFNFLWEGVKTSGN
jgi:hypothetical protein